MHLKMNLTLLLLTPLILTSLADGARILAFLPFPTSSHQRAIQPLVRELAVRGHEVVLYAPRLEFEDVPNKLTVVKIPDYLPIMKQTLKLDDPEEVRKTMIGKDTIFNSIVTVWYRQWGNQFVEWTLQQDLVQDLIKSEQKFDAVILEDSLQETFFALGHKFKAPIISYLATSNFLWVYQEHGNPYHTSYMSDFVHDLTDRMTFAERLYNTAGVLWRHTIWSLYHDWQSEKLMDKYIRYPGWEQRPRMKDMIAQTSLVLVNTHVSISYPAPWAPHFKQIGGINIQPLKPLPKDLKDFMDTAKDGVIYFSFGSIANSSAVLGDNVGKSLASAFGSLKQKVLWKWDTVLPNLPKNVKIGKWFPQQDILRHKNCVLFITHGGMLSMVEAVSSGIPTIGVPLAGDQLRNVRHMQISGYGLRLDVHNITSDSVMSAINQILNNPKYRENAKRQSNIFHDKPMTALETGIYWVEYVLRHNGAPHLKPAVVFMPWYQQAMIDVYGALAIIIFLPIFIVYKLCKCCFKLVCGKKSNKNKQKTQ